MLLFVLVQQDIEEIRSINVEPLIQMKPAIHHHAASTRNVGLKMNNLFAHV